MEGARNDQSSDVVSTVVELQALLVIDLKDSELKSCVIDSAKTARTGVALTSAPVMVAPRGIGLRGTGVGNQVSEFGHRSKYVSGPNINCDNRYKRVR